MNKIKVNGTQEFMGINIPIIEGGFGEDKRITTAKTISEIHDSRLSDVNASIKRLIENNRLKDGTDYIDILSETVSLRDLAKELNLYSSNRTRNAFILSERGYTKLIKSMDDDKSWEVMDKFIDEYFLMRQSFKENNTPQLPVDYLSALKALVKSEEQKALMQPQVEYYQKVLNPNAESEQQGYVKYVTVTAIAKDLHMSAQKLNKTLNELHIIYKQGKTWYLYAEHEDRVPEYADYIINEHGQTLKFSEKGREWIIKLLEENEVINIAS